MTRNEVSLFSITLSFSKSVLIYRLAVKTGSKAFQTFAVISIAVMITISKHIAQTIH